MESRRPGSEHSVRAFQRFLCFILFASAAHGANFTVTNTDDAGPGSLRDAIQQANAAGQLQNTIAFNIQLLGPHRITPLSPLPPITVPVTIDGYTQPGASPNTAADGDNAVLQIELDGSAIARKDTGLVLGAGVSVVRGLAIDGFGLAGISLRGQQGRSVIAGNFIGTDAFGLTAKGNQFGISVEAGSTDNTIGGPDPASRNVISGNRTGIVINGDRTKVEGNFVGTDKTGGTKLGNSTGVSVSDVKGTVIGGTTGAQRNVISGNKGAGIFAIGATDGLILGNYIGTDVGGSGALGNEEWGVYFDNAFGGVRNVAVGGTTAGAANVIAHNGKAGISVIVSADSVGNAFRGNRIFKNGKLGIDLGDDGVTANDPAPDGDKGANRLQNFPILIGIEAAGAGIKVSGVLQSVPNTSFQIDFYGNSVRDPSGHGEGEFYLGTLEPVTTDGMGQATFEATLPSQGVWVSATATRIGDVRDTSEFSPAIARAGQEFGVNTGNPTGTGSFAQAIQDSNATGNPLVVNTIRFAIPGAGTHVISPASTLTVSQPVTIDAYTQPGAAAPSPLIGIDGVGVTGGPVLNITSDNVTVRGLAFLRHSPATNIAAVQVTGNGNWLSGNLFGITPANSLIPNRIGVAVFSEDNRIGGPAVTDRNVISGNTVAGVGIGTGGKRNLIQGNLVGTDSTATQNRGNGDSGILVANAEQTRIVDNVVAFNALRGISVSGTAMDNTISRNSLFANGIGIDLSPPNGTDTNDAGDADARANGGQNFPTLASANIVASVSVAGTLASTPDSDFQIEFFVSPSCSPTGFGEGRTFLGDMMVTTDASGNGAYSITLPDTVAPGAVITTTATDPAGNTSEFSRCVAIANGPPPAAAVVGLVTPKTATVAPSTSHTVTATITSGGALVADVPVAFTIASGPNSGQNGTVTTNASGQASYSYASDGTAGTDSIVVTGIAAGVQFAASAAVTWSAAASAAVVEYYNAVLDHYFITWVPAEQANLDAGNTPTRWVRTGLSFRTYTAAQAASSPVCRFYIPPNLGDSHFFGRGTAECNATAQQNPTFVLEDPQFMHLFLPGQGVCPAATTSIYRVFSNRPDANHRYTSDRAIRDLMVTRGWLAEGDGPDLVVMCAPQ